MTKAELLNALKGIDDNALVYVGVEGWPHNVECTDVEEMQLSEGELIVILR